MTRTVNAERTRGKFNSKKKPMSENTKQKLRWIKLTAIIFILLFIISMIVNAIVLAVGVAETTDSEIDAVVVDNSSKNIASNITYKIPSGNNAPIVAENATVIFTETKSDSETEKTISEEVTETVTEPVAETRSYTDDDLFYLAAAVCREAGGATDEIQLLVANVVINRVNSSIYPNTIYEVLTQKSQYGAMWKYGISFPNWADQSIQDHCYDIARRILDGERVCPENVLFQAEFEQGSGIYKQFGDDYYFCYY